MPYTTDGSPLWRDHTAKNYLAFTLGYDGQEAGTGPFGLEIAGKFRHMQDFRNGAKVRDRPTVYAFASLYYDSDYGRFTVGRPPR